MANRHIKVINGKKYYYESIRVGKKVTSRYLGPVERIRKKKSTYTGMDFVQQLEQPQQEQAGTEEQRNASAEDDQPEDSYIG